MRERGRAYNSVLAFALPFLTPSLYSSYVAAAPSSPSTGGFLRKLKSRVFEEEGQPYDPNNPLNIWWGPAPPPELGPPASADAVRDPIYLPAQIGGIVGSYALSLVLVAVLLLALSKKRRQRIAAAEFPEQEFTIDAFPAPFEHPTEADYKASVDHFQNLTAANEQQHPRSPPNFSVPLGSPRSPTKSHRSYPLGAGVGSQHSIHTIESPVSTIRAPGIDLSVDPVVVKHDRAMAQQQLEDMYKYVMAQDEARAAGRDYDGPPLPSPSTKSTVPNSPSSARTVRKEKNKPMSLNLAKDEKTQSRGSSILSFLKSPRKNKHAQNISISSPIMTPMSGTFPRQEDQEMNAMAPRHYAPPPMPPMPPSNDLPFRRTNSNHMPTPDISPISTQSIDERIDSAVARQPPRSSQIPWRETREDKDDSSHSRDVSQATSASGDVEPVSAGSEKSTSGLVGLPTSPKPGVNRFPSFDTLPTSPKPGSTFSRANRSLAPVNTNATTAVRAGGALPLRAYEPSISSPTASASTYKQTVFTRAAPGPLSPGMRSPWTGAPVPYTPYQPFSPVIPITPSLVTREDRKRMKRLEPKTPTVEMVKGTDEIW
ncbi:hypothetical protein B0H63DRAFT_206083 [Podospora didyma]|uniref:Uncharacterized protein n=1 Tax=Podospora didyma TaxID=330526 RepID=A0AAE0NHA8_9PEZI|nr:hypothetical protein B0H63DRAFT_206083 [Podospora didyma]